MMDRHPREGETNSERASGIYSLRIYLPIPYLLLFAVFAFLFIFLCYKSRTNIGGLPQGFLTVPFLFVAVSIILTSVMELREY